MQEPLKEHLRQRSLSLSLSETHLSPHFDRPIIHMRFKPCVEREKTPTHERTHANTHTQTHREQLAKRIMLERQGIGTNDTPGQMGYVYVCAMCVSCLRCNLMTLGLPAGELVSQSVSVCLCLCLSMCLCLSLCLCVRHSIHMFILHTQAKSQQDWHAADRMGPGWPRGEQ